MPDVRYELFYWPSIQGRGEFVRLAFEEAAVPYVDVARLPEKEGGGVRALMRVLKEDGARFALFAPPILKVEQFVISQTSSILQFLAPRLGLVPKDEALQLRAHQLQLTIADCVSEAHDTHHPISSGLYYEDQKPEAQRATSNFVAERMPKYLGHFEQVLAENSEKQPGYAIGSDVSYVDLSLFQLLSGLGYAFPKAMGRLEPTIPRLLELRQRMQERPQIKAYLASKRRIPFNEHGIFRRYPELDV